MTSKKILKFLGEISPNLYFWYILCFSVCAVASGLRLVFDMLLGLWWVAIVPADAILRFLV